MSDEKKIKKHNSISEIMIYSSLSIIFSLFVFSIKHGLDAELVLNFTTHSSSCPKEMGVDVSFHNTRPEFSDSCLYMNLWDTYQVIYVILNMCE